jgi:hypothetical protein
MGIVADFELSIEGKLEGDVINAKGAAIGVQAPGIALRLSRRANLPA